VTAAAPARAVAADVLTRVETEDAFADVALDAAIAGARLTPRDAALATELTFGTLRWQRYLDWVLAPHSRRPLPGLDPAVRALLRMTAYQIAFLERVPAFAAVSDAVTLTGPRATPGVAGFVNAVLRSFARRGVREREPAPPRDPVDALATRWSFPTWLAERWIERYGTAEATALMRALDERPPLTLRANVLRVTRETLMERLAADERLTARPTPLAPDGVTVAYGGAPAAWRSFTDGLFAVQDEASMLVARLLAPQPGETIADVCAAPGTKTTHLAALMADRGRVVALDPQPARLARVREAAVRLGVTIIETRTSTVEDGAPALAAACDGVLVDAPCTNLGVVRRNPDVKWRRRRGDIGEASARQRRILDAAAGMVKPGGRLVYATCSLEPEENDAVTAAFLAGRADFAVDAPAGFPLALDAGGVLRCLPHRHGTDGFTAVRLRRAG
jgi:16S rRNA (cytosine967-C5)-methyltransferase